MADEKREHELMSKKEAEASGAAGLVGVANVAAYDLALKGKPVYQGVAVVAQGVLALIVPNKTAKVALASGAIIQGGLLIVDLIAGTPAPA